MNQRLLLNETVIDFLVFWKLPLRSNLIWSVRYSVVFANISGAMQKTEFASIFLDKLFQTVGVVRIISHFLCNLSHLF